MSDEQQTQQADDPSGPGWRDVEVGEVLQPHDMFRDGHNVWAFTENTGVTVREGWERKYRRRIEPEQQQPEPQPTTDDPSGEGWRDVEPDELLRYGDLFWNVDHWQATQHAGQPAVDERTYRRRIEPQQSSDSEPDLRQQLAEAEALVAEAERSGQQVNAELQQLREQVATLTRERDRYRNQLSGAIEHSKAPEAQAQLVDRLQAWLRPVLEVVADHPEDSSILAAAVLEFLPQIASRLIRE